ncbi:MAG: hypothetical protein LBT21_05120 [Oscillospiraceae bacterium]|jgi:hypothetical protein|nr:hypothetical protein [Oscillospiraceae bacterium]
MKKPLFSKQPPSCGYCRYGKPAPDGNSVLCPKRGVTHAGMFCKKYSYDPLRRVPKPEPKLPHYSPEDFSI